MNDDAMTNVLPLSDTDAFRILQLTDFHSDQSEFENERTRADVRAMVARHRPHFLAVTGDIWCGDGHADAAPMWMARELEFLASLETPWAFTWGNHDYTADFAASQALLAATARYGAPKMTPRGESHLALTRSDGTVAWDVFFVNTGSRWQLPKDLAWLRDRTEALHQERGALVPALVFFHIPLRRYQTAIDEGRAQGIALEDVLSWGDEADTGADLITALGNVRACFCGHSHRNDCYFEENDVIFSYGRSTGYGGYGDDVRKGAKLIELSCHSDTIDFMTVFGDGSTWRP